MDFEPSPQDHHHQNAILGRHKAIDELVQGREFANQLHSLLSKSSSQNDMSSDVVWAEDLVTKIMNSFSNTLLMLNQKNEPAAAAHHDDDEVLDVISQVQPSSSRVDSPCLEGRKSEDSQESCRSTTVISTTPSIRNSKDRRGCYKRRKNSHTWKRETPNLIDDGFAWRKYGQKDILNAKYPRSYFRCTHKYDQGCLATKQVQKIEEEPPMFRTTYHGDHTCGSLLKAPELVLDCTSPSQDSSILLSFNKTNLNLASKQAPHPFFSPFQSVKQELKDDRLPIITSHNYNQTSSSDYIVSPDDHDDHHLTAYDQSPLESDHIHEDLMSGVIMDIKDDDLEWISVDQ